MSGLATSAGVAIGSQIEKNYADATPVFWIIWALVGTYVALILVKKYRGKQ